MFGVASGRASVWSAAGLVDDRVVDAMRVILAVSALCIIYVDPFEPSRFVALTYTSLVLYSAYSAALYVAATVAGHRPEPIRRWAHWLDVGWYTVLISLSDGTNSIFFLFFLYAILVASFTSGFVEGLRVTLASAVLFWAVSLTTMVSDVGFELNRFLMRGVDILAIGYLVAYWGEREVTSKRQLALLGAVTTLSNLRLGVDHTVATFLERVRAYYGAERCVQVTGETDADECRVRVAAEGNPAAAVRAEAVSASVAKLLLSPAPDRVLFYEAAGGRWRRRAVRVAFATPGGPRLDAEPDLLEALAESLECESFLSVPVLYAGRATGRIYLTGRRGTFLGRDVKFLAQVVHQVAGIVENVRLVDRLASDAADQERRRLARDLHDSVVQPYVGLRMGLTALRQRLGRGQSVSVDDVDRLASMADEAIADVRSYTRGLKATAESGGGFVSAVERFASRFSDATGIDLRVEADDDLVVNDRLAAEAFQVIREALSNVRRHTRSRCALVEVRCAEDFLEIAVSNVLEGEGAPAPFVPRSIAERAAALGGEAAVEAGTDGVTRVAVRIPL